MFGWCIIYCKMCVLVGFFFFKQKTAYEMRISDWSSDVCSSDLASVGSGSRSGRVRDRSARVGIRPPDRDHPRLPGLRHLAHELDVDETVLQTRTAHLNVIGELEAVLERAARDAAVQVAHPLVLVLGLGPTTANQQRVLLLHQFDVALGEAGHRHRDAVLVLTNLGDVVGGIALPAVGALERGVEETRDPVEADGGTEQGREVVSTHGYPPLSDTEARSTFPRDMPPRTTQIGRASCRARGCKKV